MIRMQTKRMIGCTCFVAFMWASPLALWAEQHSMSDGGVLLRAMVDELGRSMTLTMEDLEKPYYVQYNAEDSVHYRISASYGALITSESSHDRSLSSNTRIGSYELDNTNFGGGRSQRGGFGARVSLPIDDNYMALRQEIWRCSDYDYKASVERLTRKRAYMKDKEIEDRPNDFSTVPVVESLQPTKAFVFDRGEWEKRLCRISARFKSYPRVQESSVDLVCGTGTSFVVNSEGTRLRTCNDGTLLLITAEAQAEDGTRFSSYCRYVGETVDDFPEIPQIEADVDAMVGGLVARMDAPVLEQYTGPVLFDGLASCQLFRFMLSEGVAGKVDPVGVGRRAVDDTEDLEKKLGRRILPRSFRVFDDPAVKRFEGQALWGSYDYDDDGVKAQRVELVAEGKLENMLMSRVPTKKFSQSNGHGRRASGDRTSTSGIACLFIEDRDGLSAEDLKEELIEAAKDEGLEYALRVTLLRAPDYGSTQTDLRAYFTKLQQGGSPLGDPVCVYKVYVDDGREELVRGVEFGSMEFRSLKRILAAGNTPTVYNFIGVGYGGTTPAASIVAPSVLIEELDVSKIEQEHDKLPILQTPLARKSTDAPSGT